MREREQWKVGHLPESHFGEISTMKIPSFSFVEILQYSQTQIPERLIQQVRQQHHLQKYVDHIDQFDEQKKISQIIAHISTWRREKDQKAFLPPKRFSVVRLTTRIIDVLIDDRHDEFHQLFAFFFIRRLLVTRCCFDHIANVDSWSLTKHSPQCIRQEEEESFEEKDEWNPLIISYRWFSPQFDIRRNWTFVVDIIRVAHPTNLQPSIIGEKKGRCAYIIRIFFVVTREKSRNLKLTSDDALIDAMHNSALTQHWMRFIANSRLETMTVNATRMAQV